MKEKKIIKVPRAIVNSKEYYGDKMMDERWKEEFDKGMAFVFTNRCHNDYNYAYSIKDIYGKIISVNNEELEIEIDEDAKIYNDPIIRMDSIISIHNGIRKLEKIIGYYIVEKSNMTLLSDTAFFLQDFSL